MLILKNRKSLFQFISYYKMYNIIKDYEKSFNYYSILSIFVLQK